MEIQVKQMTLVGYYHFNSKDKTKIFFVVQCLYSSVDLSNDNLRGTMINIFVDENVFNKVKSMDMGTSLDVQVSSNLETGKLYYTLEV